MPEERPFLMPPDPAGENPAGQVPSALFDLAVNRAAAALRGAGPGQPERALAAWHARTRFARRVSLGAVKAALESRPAEGDWHWAGGAQGRWMPGRAPFP